MIEEGLGWWLMQSFSCLLSVRLCLERRQGVWVDGGGRGDDCSLAITFLSCLDVCEGVVSAQTPFLRPGRRLGQLQGSDCRDAIQRGPAMMARVGG